MQIQYRYTRERNFFPTKLETPQKSLSLDSSLSSSRDGLGGGGARLGGGGAFGLTRSKNRELLDDPIHDRNVKGEKKKEKKKSKSKEGKEKRQPNLEGEQRVPIRKFV